MADHIIAQCLHLISREAATAHGLTYYFTGVPCLRGHVCKRQTSTGQCYECKLDWSRQSDARARKNLRAKEYRATPEAQEKRRQSSKEHYLKNRAEKLAYGKAYRESRREQFTQWMAEWRAKNPERARETKRLSQAKRRAAKAGGSSNDDVRSWLSRAKKVCYWCGKKCGGDFCIDHYQPLSKGGKHEASNLVIACRPCNLRKSAKDPEQFRAETWHGTLFSNLISP